MKLANEPTEFLKDFENTKDRGTLSLRMYRWLFLSLGETPHQIITKRLNELREHVTVKWVKHEIYPQREGMSAPKAHYELMVVLPNGERIKLSRPATEQWAKQYMLPTEETILAVDAVLGEGI